MNWIRYTEIIRLNAEFIVWVTSDLKTNKSRLNPPVFRDLSYRAIYCKFLENRLQKWRFATKNLQNPEILMNLQKEIAITTSQKSTLDFHDLFLEI